MPYAPVLRCAVAVLLSAAAAPVAAADDGWSLAPSASAPGGRPYVYAEGAPGTVLQDSVSVLNPGARPVTVRLRGADADNTADGDLTVRAAGKSRDTGAWIAFAGDRDGRRVPVRTLSLRVPAHTRADVPFTVSVPAGATPGDHPGAVVAGAAWPVLGGPGPAAGRRSRGVGAHRRARRRARRAHLVRAGQPRQHRAHPETRGTRRRRPRPGPGPCPAHPAPRPPARPPRHAHRALARPRRWTRSTYG